MKFLSTIKFILISILISACGTDTDSGTISDNNPPDNPMNGQVTVTTTGTSTTSSKSSLFLRLTDAPIDYAAKVVITLLSVELKSDTPARSILFDFTEPKVVDLLQLQGTQTMDLLDNIEIDSGEYNEIRLIVDDSNTNSYIELLDGNVYPLTIPSGSTSGLKLKGDITIPANKPGRYTVDFDVRQSIVRAGNSSKYLLKPVLRLVDDTLVGHIRGTIDPALLVDASCSDNNVDTHNAVYVYEGSNVLVDDIDLSSDLNIDPVATGTVGYDSSTDSYIFESAFLTAGDYTIAITCNADLEDIESDNELLFFNIQNVVVQVNDIQFL